MKFSIAQDRDGSWFFWDAAGLPSVDAFETFDEAVSAFADCMIWLRKRGDV